jgi:hypothetical protein
MLSEVGLDKYGGNEINKDPSQTSSSGSLTNASYQPWHYFCICTIKAIMYEFKHSFQFKDVASR